MKEFLLTLLSGFIFIVVSAAIVFIGLSVMLLISTIIPKTILYIIITIFVVWFVGAVIS